ncbi:MAG: response regulator transcription factor [Chloroflexi bacterium]|nr:response regulator transcription factor [Chloroflexota bacterium]
MIELFPRNAQTAVSGLEFPVQGLVTVLVAVHKPQVREALIATIETMEGFEVVGEASSEDEAVASARRLRPVLALVDEDLPSCCGAWTIQTLAEERLARGIVGIGLRGNGGIRARAAGADAYVQTGASTEELQQALRSAAAFSLPLPHLLR